MTCPFTRLFLKKSNHGLDCRKSAAHASQSWTPAWAVLIIPNAALAAWAAHTHFTMIFLPLKIGVISEKQFIACL
jgi:hypothetical protein